MKSRVFLLFALLLVIAGAADRASACDCSPGLASDAFDQSDIVFVGRVAEISRETLESTRAGDREFPNIRLWAKLIVEERFKGVDGDAVVVSPGEEGSTCSAGFRVGERYLVFATRSPEDGRWMTSRCTPTLAVEQSAANMAYCRHRTRTGNEPRIIGSVNERTSPAVIGAGIEANPVGGIEVTLEAAGLKHSAVTDATGAFVFSEIPNGEYTIRFKLPDGWRMLQFWTSQNNEQSDSIENRVRIEDRTLAVNAHVTPSGGLVGHILDSNGRPLKDITMTAIPRERAGSMQPNEQFPMSYSSETGEFDFGVLPEGEYVLLVNWSGLPPDIGRPPFPSYWYASPSSPDCTAVFKVKKGCLINLGDVKAPPTPEHVVVDVELVNAAGELEMGILDCRREDGGFVGHAMVDGERKRTQIFLPTGTKYVLTVRLAEDPSEDVAEPVLVDPAKPPREIKFVAVMPEVP